MTQLSFDTQALDEARNFNRKLALLPRFKVRNRYMPLLVQSLLRMSQVGGGRKLARLGIKVEQREEVLDGCRVPLRILRPPGELRGVVLDFHGGGWVIGNAQMDDTQNAALALACQVAVVSVDYRLAVFTPIDDIMDDCLAAARWLLESEEPGLAGLPVMVVGESAGGHLAAATLLRLKAWPELLRRVRGAVLYYGVYDLAGTPSVRQAGADTLVLDGPGMVEGLRLLTPGMSDEQRRQPPLSPLYGDWSGMPPALLFAGELDPLRDDTVELAQRWGRCAEVEVQLPPEAPHGFIRFPHRMARQVLEHTHAWISKKIAKA